MRTVKTIRVGKGALVLRSSGHVYWVRDAEAARGRSRGRGRFDPIDHGVLLVTSAPGCDALAEALREMAPALREAKLRAQCADCGEKPVYDSIANTSTVYHSPTCPRYVKPKRPGIANTGNRG